MAMSMASMQTSISNGICNPKMRAKPLTMTKNTRSRGSSCVRMAMREDGPSVAIAGVTGAVGQEFLSVLSERNFPYRSLTLLASKRSSGKHITFEGRDYVVEELTEDSFNGIDIALFSAGGSISKKFGPIAADKGTIVVDNSSAFRMDDNIPLVIPEVNSHAMAHIKLSTKKGALIANPNCSTIICLMAVTPLHRHAKVKRMVVSTYQAASGAGAAAMAELEQQTREVLEGKQPTCNIFSQQYAFNLFSHNSKIFPTGYNEEETKLVKETKKIWDGEDVKITATCIRVPVMRAHAESINLEFQKPLDEVLFRCYLGTIQKLKNRRLVVNYSPRICELYGNNSIEYPHPAIRRIVARIAINILEVFKKLNYSSCYIFISAHQFSCTLALSAASLFAVT